MDFQTNIRKALNFEEGPVPIDLGALPQTGLHCSCVEQLREYYGLVKRPVKIHEPFQMLGWIDQDLREAIGVDVVSAEPIGTMFGVPPTDWKDWKTPWGQDVLIPGRLELREDRGVVFAYPQGDRSSDPSAVMPGGGYFFDALVRQPDFDEDELNPEDNLEEFQLISDEDISRMKTAVEEASSTGYLVAAGIGGTALGDIALVPAPFLKAPKGIRDIEEWYVSTAIRKDYVREIFERQTDIALENFKKVFAAVGNLMDVLFLCGTDFGTQSGTFCSKETFDDLWLPYYQKMTGWIHSNTEWKVFKHSCGAVEGFMDGFIEAGIDIINPVQCSAAGMDPQTLKERYGRHLVFWGGGVDTQKTLPFGTPEEIREQVLERCAVFSQGGGFVFNAIHNVQAQTPVENIVAMINAVKEFNFKKRAKGVTH